MSAAVLVTTPPTPTPTPTPTPNSNPTPTPTLTPTPNPNLTPTPNSNPNPNPSPNPHPDPHPDPNQVTTPQRLSFVDVVKGVEMFDKVWVMVSASVRVRVRASRCFGLLRRDVPQGWVRVRARVRVGLGRRDASGYCVEMFDKVGVPWP